MGKTLNTRKTTRNKQADNKTMTTGKEQRIYDYWNLATWNVRGLNKKDEELVEELKKRQIDIAVISETKKKGRGSTEMGDYHMIYSGVEKTERAKSGIAILIKQNWRKK